MWFDVSTGIWIGALGGSLLGIIGGTLGAIASKLAPKGKCRGLILNTMKILIAIGILFLITGIIAFFVGQPYHVWYPLTLLGGIASFVIPFPYLQIKKMYTASELKKMYIDDMK